MLHNENSRVKTQALVHFTRLGYEHLSLKNYTGKGLINKDTNIFTDLLCVPNPVSLPPLLQRWKESPCHHRSPYDNQYRSQLHDVRYYRNCAGVMRWRAMY